MLLETLLSHPGCTVHAGARGMGRKFGLAFMVVGVIGIVISLLFVPAIWIGHAFVDSQITSLADQVRAPLQQAEGSIGDARARVENVQGTLNQMKQLVQQGNGTVEQQLANRLLALVDQISPEYQRLRQAYLSIRDSVVAANQLVTTLQRVFPSFPQPNALPTDQIVQLDAQLQNFDASLQQIRADLTAGTLPDNLPGVEALRRISDGVSRADQTLDSVIGLINSLDARIQQMQAQVDQTQASAQRVVTIIAIVLTIGFAYVALLHAALFAYGRSLRRAALTPTLSADADAKRDDLLESAQPA
jgi:uncharacterized phage infection (PIP) family protein YhgE